MEHRWAQPREEGANTAGQESSEPHSLVVATQEDHAQALLTTPGHQVRPSSGTPLSLVQAQGGVPLRRAGTSVPRD